MKNRSAPYLLRRNKSLSLSDETGSVDPASPAQRVRRSPGRQGAFPLGKSANGSRRSSPQTRRDCQPPGQTYLPQAFDCRSAGLAGSARSRFPVQSGWFYRENARQVPSSAFQEQPRNTTLPRGPFRQSALVFSSPGRVLDEQSAIAVFTVFRGSPAIAVSMAPCRSA